MICSASELGLAESSDGILPLPADAPVGTDFRDYLALDDALYRRRPDARIAPTA